MFLYQPPTPPKTQVIYRGRTTLPQARSTMEYVAKRLPPANPEILRAIKSNLAKRAEFNRAKFLEDVKSDPVVFLNTARRLPTVIEAPQRPLDPLQALADVEQDKLESLFSNPFPTSHEHHLEQMTKTQAQTLKLTIACAKYAEALSQKTSVAPSLAFTHALIRQIGLNLVAWNYPSIYSRALAKHRAHGEDIHSELERMLGIPPRKLGLRLARDWGIHFSSIGGDDEATNHLTDLAEICALSEDPENFPEATALLQFKEEEIKKLIDLPTFNKVKESIEGNFKRFAKVAPVVALVVKKAAVNDAVSPLFISESVLQRNPHLSRTNSEVKIAFGEVYSKLLDRAFSGEAIKHLVDKVVPSVGFENGCLFLISKRPPHVLHAALRFGAIPLAAYGKFLEHTTNMIKDSVDTLTACRSDGLGVGGEIITYLSAGFNHLRHEGVLYLEMAQDLREDPTFEATLIFQIIRQTLKDCLDGA